MGADLTDLARRRARQQDTPAQAKHATIRSSPESDDDEVYVTIDSQSTTQKRGPCRWMPRGAELPTAGDKAVVMETDKRQLVIVVWWPS